MQSRLLILGLLTALAALLAWCCWGTRNTPLPPQDDQVALRASGLGTPGAASPADAGSTVDPGPNPTEAVQRQPIADGSADALPRHLPAALTAFLRGCLLPSPSHRPNDAWALFDDFQTLLKKLYGPPSFRPFSI